MPYRAPQHFLNFRPLPHGQGSLRPALPGAVRGPGARSPGRHSLERRPAVQEEALQSRAQVVEARFALRRPDETVLGASAVAHGQHFAFAAVTRQGVPLGLAEIPLRRAFQQLAERRLADVAQAVFAVDVVVAREKVAVVFDNRDLAAGFAENA